MGKKNKKVLVRTDNVSELSDALSKLRLSNDEVCFVCVGTDRSTGDAIGPLVGTFLEELGYKNVIGTLDNPLHAVNLDERLAKELPKDKTIIAIDACLGRMKNIGYMALCKGSLKPGAGVDKDLTPVGDYFIEAVVNVSGFMEFFVLQNTKLSLVMHMARTIADGISLSFPLITTLPEVQLDMDYEEKSIIELALSFNDCVKSKRKKKKIGSGGYYAAAGWESL